MNNIIYHIILYHSFKLVFLPWVHDPICLLYDFVILSIHIDYSSLTLVFSPSGCVTAKLTLKLREITQPAKL